MRGYLNQQIDIPCLGGKYKLEYVKEDEFAFRFVEMYDAPSINALTLIELTYYFGTSLIDIDEVISDPGCDTCDYGSEYGNLIIVRNATQNIPTQNG